MFSKPTRDAASEIAASAPRKLEPASLVAAGVRIAGNVETQGDLHLDGAVEGDLRVGLLVIGEAGSVSGAVHADAVEIRGRVTGVICARRVKLWATARVDGDISHTELSIEAGAHFEGRSLALISPADETPALSVVAAE
ncbi:MAG: polymer-forming cytoskeletal protein [Phenylobacterium sp.]|uniref:bactofilin family protein n=1 Tax=Phenylobacterium sp. TaxID=1871053 RepID=UPI001A4E46F5|nr:polymer-forming cytoskeletal protein [Phenylobacterium sp.]MBL8553036.1 polymer-forming cytoskeletal protein [Phenylobacterium sp.]